MKLNAPEPDNGNSVGLRNLPETVVYERLLRLVVEQPILQIYENERLDDDCLAGSADGFDLGFLGAGRELLCRTERE